MGVGLFLIALVSRRIETKTLLLLSGKELGDANGPMVDFRVVALEPGISARGPGIV